jgi:hypothetical protein
MLETLQQMTCSTLIPAPSLHPLIVAPTSAPTPAALPAPRAPAVATAAANYGNTGLLTVIFLYLVAEGIYQTGGLELIVPRMLGRSRSTFWGLVSDRTGYSL